MNKPEMLSIMLALMLLFAAWQHDSSPQQLRFTTESTIRIEGTSTLHDWSCSTGAVEGTMETEKAEPPLGVEAAHLSVSIDPIDCGDGTMNDKLRGALKAKKHPTITYSLQRVDTTITSADGTRHLRTTGALTIAGKTKVVATDIEAQRTDGGAFRFVGSVPLKMTDFGVKPPSVFFGALKAGNKITIAFNLVAEPEARVMSMR